MMNKKILKRLIIVGIILTISSIWGGVIVLYLYHKESSIDIILVDIGTDIGLTIVLGSYFLQYYREWKKREVK